MFPLSFPECPHSRFVFCTADCPSSSFLLFLCLSCVSCLREIGMGVKDFWEQEGFGGGRCGACYGPVFITWRHVKERLQER